MMKYNYKLQSEVLNRLNQIKKDSNLNYFVFDVSNFSHHPTLRFRVKQSLNKIRNHYGITNNELKYVGIIETSSKLSKKEYLFDEDIIDMGLHIHLFVSSPLTIDYETIKEYISTGIKRSIMSKGSEIGLWVGDDKIDIYDPINFFSYHTKQFSIDRSMEFVVTNLSIK
ncbi:MAG: hypothetical protein P8O87_09825 [Crocinitomicaceae bacterium]|nr:hypothetical protein [Crocinitomicaceae bacterium]